MVYRSIVRNPQSRGVGSWRLEATPRPSCNSSPTPNPDSGLTPGCAPLTLLGRAGRGWEMNQNREDIPLPMIKSSISRYPECNTMRPYLNGRLIQQTHFSLRIKYNAHTLLFAVHVDRDTELQVPITLVMRWGSHRFLIIFNSLSPKKTNQKKMWEGHVDSVDPFSSTCGNRVRGIDTDCTVRFPRPQALQSGRAENPNPTNC